MILEASKTLIEDIEAAKKAGFTADFMYIGQKIIDRKTKIEYINKDCVLIEFCRHEDLTYFFVHLKSKNGEMITIPNSVILQKSIATIESKKEI